MVRVQQSRALSSVGAEASRLRDHTGFGALCEVVIRPGDTRTLQENILMSHAAGVGDPLPPEVVRAAVAVRAADLGQGSRGAARHAAGARGP